MGDVLRLGIPSKGALYQGTVELLESCMVPVGHSKSSRTYHAKLAGFDDVAVTLSRADEMPELLHDDQLDAAITGLDLVREAELATGLDAFQVAIPDLEFGSARLVVAVPAFWLDVESMNDLVDVCLDIRHENGRAVRVATKFTGLTRKFFTDHGLTDFRLVQSLGATESAPRSGSADVVVDLTSTGTTIRSNGLKEIEGGTVLRSQACLVASKTRETWASARKRESFSHLIRLIEGSFRAKHHRWVQADFCELVDPDEQAALGKGFVDASWNDSGTRLAGWVRTTDMHPVLIRLGAREDVEVQVEDCQLLLNGRSPAADAFFASVDRSKKQ